MMHEYLGSNYDNINIIIIDQDDNLVMAFLLTDIRIFKRYLSL